LKDRPSERATRKETAQNIRPDRPKQKEEYGKPHLMPLHPLNERLVLAFTGLLDEKLADDEGVAE
jgi:hypothetical protein